MEHAVNPIAADSRIPVTLVTGMRGSGKTAWISAQLHGPRRADTLVVLDPVSGAGLTHPLVAYVREPATAPAGGCLCCSLRQDLVRTLVNAIWRYSREGRRLYSRVIIETTGDASPAPILAVLAELPALARRYRVESMTTLVDAATGLTVGSDHAVAAEQLAHADLIVLSKTAALPAAELNTLQLRLRDRYPRARLTTAPTVYAPVHA